MNTAPVPHLLHNYIKGVVLIGLPLAYCSEAGMNAITKSTNADFIHLLHFNRIFLNRYF